MFPAWLCSKCIGKKLKWNNESHVPSSSSVLQSFESSIEILAWGWHMRQRWVTPVICWLKCSLSIIRPNSELVYGVGLCSFCSRVFFVVVFLTLLVFFLLRAWYYYYYYKLLFLDYSEVFGLKILHWLGLETKAEFHVVQRCFCCWLWLLPWGHRDSKDYFSEPCQEQLGNRFWRL